MGNRIDPVSTAYSFRRQDRTEVLEGNLQFIRMGSTESRGGFQHLVIAVLYPHDIESWPIYLCFRTPVYQSILSIFLQPSKGAITIEELGRVFGRV